MLTIDRLGRSWSIQELREKSWDDLHSLWWVCVKERNRIATSDMERKRLKAGYGEWESSERDRVVGSVLLLVYVSRLMKATNVLLRKLYTTLVGCCSPWCSMC